MRRIERTAAVERLEDRTLLTTFNVNSFADTVDADPGDGVAADSNGNTTLRAAIMEANALAGDDTIQIGAGTVSLNRSGVNEDVAATGDLDILNNGSITITGAGAGLTTINVHGMGDRAFDVLAGASLTLDSLTIRNASGGSQSGYNGGAIQNNGGSVTINDSVLTNNRASNRGGGIYNHSGGSVYISGSTLSLNRANFGGGIYTTGPGTVVTIVDSILSGNSTNSGSSGAGILNNGGSSILNIIDSTLTGNAAGNGGGIYNTGQLTITGSTFSGNTAQSSGGAINNRHTGVANINNSTFDGNTAGSGGAIHNTHTGITNITASTLSGNSAGSGGAAYNGFQGGELTIIDSTVSGNSAVLGGAIRNTSSGGSGIAHVINSTLSGNSADTDGGAIYNANSGSRVNISNSTLAGNRADADGDATGSGGGLFNGTLSSFVTLDNTIVAGNLRGTGTVADEIGGDISTAGSFNLIANAGSAGGLSDGNNGNIVASIPVAGILDTTLADNGGPTLTHALVVGSPAIDVGDPNFDNTNLPYDQRGSGFARIIGGQIDIGAFEVQNAPPTAHAGGPYSVAEGADLMLDGSNSSDPDEANGTLSFAWDLDYDGTTFHVDTTGETPTVSFPDNFATRTIALRVTDSAGESDIATTTLTVTNVAPTLSITGPTTANEGETKGYTFTTSDPGDDTFALNGVTAGPDATVSNIVFNTATGAGSFDVTFHDGPGDASIAVQLEDSDGAAAANSGVTVLDATFGDGGIVVTDVRGDNQADIPFATAIQPDGKVLVGGWSREAGGGVDFAIVRYNVDGTLDTTFGSGGAAIFGNFSPVEEIHVLSNGQLLVRANRRLHRLNSNGSLDNSFGTSTGSSLVPFVSPGEFFTVVLTDGRIVVGGIRDNGTLDANGSTTQDFDFALARFDADGNPDTAFGTNGIASFDLGNSEDRPSGLLLDTSDPAAERLVMYGQKRVYDPNGPSSTTNYVVVRLDVDGSFDTTYGGGDGLWEELADFTFVSAAVGPDGKVVLGGSDTAPNSGTDRDFRATRLKADGSGLDTTFDGDGTALIDFDAERDFVRSVVVDEQGRVVLSGEARINGTQFSAIARLNTDGSPDTTFSDDGKDVGTFIFGRAVAAANGAIALVGDAPGGNFGVARYATGGVTVAVANVAPSVAADSGTVTTNEGSTATNTGTFSDPGDDVVALTTSIGAVVDNGNGTWTWSWDTTDGPDDSQNVTVTATDSDGAATDTTFALAVNNVAPHNVVTDAGIEEYVFAVGTTMTFAGTFDDVGTADTHDEPGTLWTFSHVVGTSTVTETRDATVNEAANTVSDDFSFTEAGVYTVTLKVTDDDGGATTSTARTFVVYDPSEGFVTGGGWIDSPEGAYVPDATLTGKATFGFVSKYKKGQSTPTGNTNFEFKVADLKFKSTSYDWLVVAGARAQYKGEGTINGTGNYGFLLTVIDGQVNGGGGTDKFRMKIWDKDNGDAIVYDNAVGASDDDAPPTALGGGSVIIHNNGKALHAAADANGFNGLTTLTPELLDPAVDRAIAHWAAAGADTQQIDLLRGVDVQIANLRGPLLGMASAVNTVWIDSDAAGLGWGGGAFDLVSVVSHELGHMIGLDDISDLSDVMGAYLSPGVSRLPVDQFAPYTSAPVRDPLTGGFATFESKLACDLESNELTDQSTGWSPASSDTGTDWASLLDEDDENRTAYSLNDEPGDQLPTRYENEEDIDAVFAAVHDAAWDELLVA